MANSHSTGTSCSCRDACNAARYNQPHHPLDARTVRGYIQHLKALNTQLAPLFRAIESLSEERSTVAGLAALGGHLTVDIADWLSSYDDDVTHASSTEVRHG